MTDIKVGDMVESKYINSLPHWEHCTNMGEVVKIVGLWAQVKTKTGYRKVMHLHNLTVRNFE